jgi:DNA-binding transcriptional regulator GbsR (MarR family)
MKTKQKKTTLKKMELLTTASNGVPWWLIDLIPGKYRAADICELTGQTRSNVYIRMRLLKVERVILSQKKKGLKPALFFLWKGAKFYRKKQIEAKNEI